MNLDTAGTGVINPQIVTEVVVPVTMLEPLARILGEQLELYRRQFGQQNPPGEQI